MHRTIKRVLVIGGVLVAGVVVVLGPGSVGSWLARRAIAFGELAAAAAFSPWAWLYVVLVFASGWAAARRLLGGIGFVLLGALLVFFLGPHTSLFPGSQVSADVLLTNSPAHSAEVFLRAFGEQRGSLTNATYVLGALVGNLSAVVLVAHQRGTRYAATIATHHGDPTASSRYSLVGSGGRPTAIWALSEAMSGPLALPAGARRTLRFSALATVVTVVSSLIATGAVWAALATGDFAPIPAVDAIGEIGDPTRSALLAGWYPSAFVAVFSFAGAAAIYAYWKGRYVYDRPDVPVAISTGLSTALFAAIFVLLVPSGVLTFLSGFTIMAAVLTPGGLWRLHAQPTRRQRPVTPKRDRQSFWQRLRPRSGRRLDALEVQQHTLTQQQRRLEADLRALRVRVQELPEQVRKQQQEGDGLQTPPSLARSKPPPHRPVELKPSERGGLATRPRIATLVAHPRQIMAGCLVDDGAVALLERDGAVAVYRQGRLSRRVSGVAADDGVLLSVTTGEVLYVVSATGIRVIDTREGSMRAVGSPGDPIDAAAVNPMGSCVAVACPAVSGSGSVLRAVFVERGEPQELGSTAYRVRAMAYSPDSRILAAVGDEGRVALLDVATRKPRDLRVGEVEEPVAVAATMSGGWAVAGGNHVVLFDENAPERAERLTVTRKIVAFAAAPDGSAVATGSARGKVQVCGGRQWVTRFDQEVHDGSVLHLAVDEDGAVTSFGSDGTVRRFRP